MVKDILFINDVNQHKDNLFKEDFGYYDYNNDVAYINLYIIKDWAEDKIISEIISTISHEELHSIIWQCRKDYGDKFLFDFFEEKIIREALGEPWDPEDYYHLVQINEDEKMSSGDDGTTDGGLAGRVKKCNCLYENTGDIDSLHSSLNKIVFLYNKEENTQEQINLMDNIYLSIQNIGGEIILGKQAILCITNLEDSMEQYIKPVTGFQRFNTELSLELNEARVRTRKLERTLVGQAARQEVIAYVNRLSKLLFILAVYEDDINEEENK